MASIPAGPLLIVALAAVAYGIERLRDRAGKPSSPPLPPTEAELQLAIDAIARDARVELLASIGVSSKPARLKSSFLLFRARRLVERDPTLRDPSRAAAWKAGVVASFRQVEQYLARKLGTVSARGPLFGGATDLQPPHLDLARFAVSRWTDAIRGFDLTTDADAVAATSPTKSQRFARTELDRRRARVLDIVWRAAGIEAGVWDADGTLREPDLTEMLDRRLRSVERLAYQACAGAKPDGLGSSNVERRFATLETGATAKSGPIKDDYLVRPFEAPSMPENAFPTIFVAANEAETARYSLAARAWYLNRVTHEYDLDVWPGTRPGERGFVGIDLPPQALPVWELAPDEPAERRGYAWILTPQGDFAAAAIVEELFVRAQNANWFERSLLHSDGVFSALHLEALRHALLRRNGSDQQFDALLDRYDLVLGDAFGILGHARVPRSIFAPGVTDHFQNEAIAEADLQVGDQLLFDVHPVLFGLWGREYPTVMVTAIDPAESGIATVARIRVQGFDTADLTVGEFQRLHVEQMDRLLDVLREYATDKAAHLAGGGRIAWQAGEVDPFLRADLPAGVNDEKLLVEFTLFTDPTLFGPPGAIWIKVIPAARIWRGLVPDDLTEAVRRIPKSIAVIENGLALLVHERGAAVRLSLDPDIFALAFLVRPELFQHRAIYVPLFEPDGGWPEFYREKQTNPTRTWLAFLGRVHVDGAWVPKIARDEQNRIRVVRPRLKPPQA